MTLRDRLRQVVPPILVRWRRPVPNIPDRDLYQPSLRYHPMYSPWFGERPFRQVYDTVHQISGIDPESAWIVWSLARQCAHLSGDFIEAGVYRGGSALLILDAIERTAGDHRLHLFDSFAGLPAPGARDLHKVGEFADTNVTSVRARFPPSSEVAIHQGWIPETFADSGVGPVAFAHVDLDLERSIIDACAFLYPRLLPGGVMVFDDYGWSSCPGARAAVDEFFRDLPEVPLVLATGQAVVTRLPPSEGQP